MPNGETLELEQDPVQQEEELELAPKGTDADPLDEIQDVDALRAEAKKFRAISSRHKEPKIPVEKKEEPVAVKPEDGFLKKSDFELANQKKAIKTVTTVSEQDSDEQKKLKSDVLENWDAIRQFYTPRRGKDTPEDVQEDIMDAYVLFNARRKPKEAKPDVSELTEHAAMGGSSETPKVEIQKKTLNVKLGKKPNEWY